MTVKPVKKQRDKTLLYKTQRPVDVGLVSRKFRPTTFSYNGLWRPDPWLLRIRKFGPGRPRGTSVGEDLLSPVYPRGLMGRDVRSLCLGSKIPPKRVEELLEQLKDFKQTV